MNEDLPITQKIIETIKGWPQHFVDLVRSPKTTIATLPSSGKWDLPAIQAGTVLVTMSLITFVTVARYSMEYAFRGLLTTLIAGAIIFPVSIFIFNWIIGFFGKDPGFYRTAVFATTMGILGPVSYLLNIIHPIVGLVPFLAWIYVLYYYVQEAGGWTTKKAQILAAILAILTIGPYLTGRIGGNYLAHQMMNSEDTKAVQEMMKAGQLAQPTQEKPSSASESEASAQPSEKEQQEEMRKAMQLMKQMEAAQKNQPSGN